MATAISPITRQYSTPYLSLDEFKNAPTALDYGNIVAGGNQAAQDKELSNAITRASSYIDQFCNQVIGATNDTEQQRVRLRPDGTFRLHPKYFPVVALTSLSYGFTPLAQDQNVATDCSIAWLEEQEIIFPYAQMSNSWSSQGPLSFGMPSASRAETYVRYSYVNGYTNTNLAANVLAGATSITVADADGIVAGQSIKIYDGANTENVVVGSTYTFGSTTVPLTAPLQFAHTTGASFSSLPAAVKQAAILITGAFLKIRGDASLTMAVTNTPSAQADGNQRVSSDIALAEEMLKPFRRIR